MYLSVYLCVYLSIYLSIYLSLYISIYLSIYLSIYSGRPAELLVVNGGAVAVRRDGALESSAAGI